MIEGNPGTTLLDAVRAWPTPLVNDAHNNNNNPGQQARNDPQLNVVAGSWGDFPTPWPTPTVAADRKSTRAMSPFPEGYSSPPGLEQAAELAMGVVPHDAPAPLPVWLERYRNAPSDFPTPSATEYGSSQNGINGKGGAFERPSAGTPSLSTAARKGALPGGAKGVLNPFFVEALMGWPLGWSDPEVPAGRSVPFPPPPRDTEGWARYLAENPEAIPAVPSDAVERRIDRLRACGNGVVPQQAAAAFGELFDALGVANAHEALVAAMQRGLAPMLQWQRDRVEAYAEVAMRGWKNCWRARG